jgi:Tol biopolymer transport system component
VTVTAGDTTGVTLSLSCTQAEPAGHGREIGFVYQPPRHAQGQIYLVNNDETGLVRLTENAVLDRGPTWSPDGTTLAFRGLLTERGEIFVIDGELGQRAGGKRRP